ncbi:SEC-C metal-binding domain-containing protein [Escherichia coli]
MSSQIKHSPGNPGRFTKTKLTEVFGAVGRNEQCPCGSGIKYKKCHGA